MKKRYVIGIMVFMLVGIQIFALCGCGGNNGENNNQNDYTQNDYTFEMKVLVRDTDFQQKSDVIIKYNGNVAEYDSINHIAKINTANNSFDKSKLSVEGYNCIATDVKDHYSRQFVENDEVNVITLIVWNKDIEYTHEDFVNIGIKVVDNESYLSETRITQFDIFVNGAFAVTPNVGDINLNCVLIGTEIEVVNDKYDWVDAANNPAGPAIVTKYDNNNCITFRGVLKK